MQRERHQAHAAFGVEAAHGKLEARAGSAYEPRLVERYLKRADELTAGLEDTSWDDVLALEPEPHVLSAAEFDEACLAMADYADLKSPYSVGHSRAVAALAAEAARRCGLPEADVARGYCDAPAASRLRVSSNSRAGYLISIFSRLPIFKSVRVDMADASAQISRDGGAIAQRGRHGKEMPTQMAYRFMLADGVGPGTYPWPLALDVRPI